MPDAYELLRQSGQPWPRRDNADPWDGLDPNPVPLGEPSDATDAGYQAALEQAFTNAPADRDDVDRAPPPQRETKAARPAAYPLIWASDLAQVLDAKDFVQGLLLESGATVVYGESNSGKTFWATDLALHVAAGRDWNGRRVEQGGVVYVALEGGYGFRNRVAAWCTETGIDRATLRFAAITVGVNLLQHDADVQSLIEAIKAAADHICMPVRLVIIDTLSRALAGGDENSSQDMGALVKGMDLIRAETSANVTFIHHSGKDAARGARGHSLLRAAIDTEVEITADPESDARTATVVKQRDLPKGGTFGFRLHPLVIGENRHGEAVTTCIVQHNVEQATPTKFVKLTADETGWLRDISRLL